MENIVILVNGKDSPVGTQEFTEDVIYELKQRFPGPANVEPVVIDIDGSLAALKDVATSGVLTGKHVITNLVPQWWKGLTNLFSLENEFFKPEWLSLLPVYPQIEFAKDLTKIVNRTAAPSGSKSVKPDPRSVSPKQELFLAEDEDAGVATVMVRGRPVKKRVRMGDSLFSLGSSGFGLEKPVQTQDETFKQSEKVELFPAIPFIAPALSVLSSIAQIGNTVMKTGASSWDAANKVTSQVFAVGDAIKNNFLNYTGNLSVKVVDALVETNGQIVRVSETTKKEDVRAKLKLCFDDAKVGEVVFILPCEERDLQLVIEVINEQFSNSKGLKICFMQYVPQYLQTLLRKDNLFGIQKIEQMFGDRTELSKAAESIAILATELVREDAARASANLSDGQRNEIYKLVASRTYTADGPMTPTSTVSITGTLSFSQNGVSGLEETTIWSGDRSYGKAVFSVYEDGEFRAKAISMQDAQGTMQSGSGDFTGKPAEDMASEVEKAMARIAIAEKKLSTAETAASKLEQTRKDVSKLTAKLENVLANLEKEKEKKRKYKLLAKKHGLL